MTARFPNNYKFCAVKKSYELWSIFKKTLSQVDSKDTGQSFYLVAYHFFYKMEQR